MLSVAVSSTKLDIQHSYSKIIVGTHCKDGSWYMTTLRAWDCLCNSHPRSISISIACATALIIITIVHGTTIFVVVLQFVTRELNAVDSSDHFC